MDRGSAILADVILIGMTWKLLPDLGIRNRGSQDRPTRTKGLASIMLFNGLCPLVLIVIRTDVSAIIPIGMIYFM